MRRYTNDIVKTDKYNNVFLIRTPSYHYFVQVRLPNNSFIKFPYSRRKAWAQELFDTTVKCYQESYGI